MKHGAHPDARPKIRRTSRQIADIRIEGIVQAFFQDGIGSVYRAPCLPQLKSRAERLHAQMVFLIDHETEGFIPVKDQAAACTLGSMLTTNKMTLNQDLFVQG